MEKVFIKFASDSWLSEYMGYEFISEEEAPLFEDEVKDGIEGYVNVIKVRESFSGKVYKGLVRCSDSVDYFCYSFEEETGHVESGE